MFPAQYARTWGHEDMYDSDQPVRDELSNIHDLVDRRNLEEEIYEAITEDEEGLLQLQTSHDSLLENSDSIREATLQYSRDEKEVRLEYDRDRKTEFALYVNGDDHFRDDVTASTDIHPRKTLHHCAKDFLDDKKFW
jgi:hypothetical protein